MSNLYNFISILIIEKFKILEKDEIEKMHC